MELRFFHFQKQTSEQTTLRELEYSKYISIFIWDHCCMHTFKQYVEVYLGFLKIYICIYF